MNLPEHHHPDDKKWILEQFQVIASSMHPGIVDSVAAKYSQVYADTYEQSDLVNEREGIARREANTRLRKYIGNLQAKAILPPSN